MISRRPLARGFWHTAPALIVLAILGFSAAWAQVQPSPPLNFTSVGTGWRIATFPKQAMPVTTYTDVLESGRNALRLEAQGSYGPLVKALAPPAPLKEVRWSWRVGQQSNAINLRTKAGDDAAAKVCMSFVWPDERVPFVERQLLRIARSRGNPDLPAATLCWVWVHAETPDNIIENPYTRRVRSIVVRNATHLQDGWQDEHRDIMRDLRLAFGDEWPSGAVEPLVTAVFLAADADNTRSHSIAWISDLRYN